jgi:hypothetical protein
MIATAREQRRPLHLVEQDQDTITHAEVGAHLLALWGLPHAVTEAVAGHHGREWLKLPFDAVAVTYVANALVEEVEAELLPGPLPAAELDLDYLAAAGVATRLSSWRQMAIRLCLRNAA